MSDATSTMIVERREPSLLEKVAALASWVLAGAIFLTVGWMAMEPDDPLGSVSALARADGILMLIQAAVLAAVCGGLATVIAGRRMADVGTLAAALGLALVSLRGATAEYLLVQGAEISDSFERGLALSFVLEALGWFLVMIVTIGVSALVTRWCFGRRAESGLLQDHPSSIAAPTPAGFDGLSFSVRCFGVSAEDQTVRADGVKHMLIATVVGLAATMLLSAGLYTRSIQHGQVIFVVAAAMFMATYVAYHFVPVRSALWSVLAVGLVAIIGYFWGVLRPSVPGLPPNIPSTHFMRILPIQFISVGTVAALAAFWNVYVPVDPQSTSPSRQRSS